MMNEWCVSAMSFLVCGVKLGLEEVCESVRGEGYMR